MFIEIVTDIYKEYIPIINNFRVKGDTWAHHTSDSTFTYAFMYLDLNWKQGKKAYPIPPMRIISKFQPRCNNTPQTGKYTINPVICTYI